MFGNAKRYIEVIIKGKDDSGPLWSNLGTRLKDLTKNKAALAAAALAAGAAIVRMVSAAVQAYDRAITKAGVFQKSVLEVGTLTGASAGETRELSKELQVLAVQYGQLAEVMARAQYNVVSAGFGDVADSLLILDVASRAAIGGITDVNTAAKTITQTLNAYGLGAEHAESVAGTLFATIKGGVTTFEELSPALGMVTSTAAAAGISFEEVSAALAVLTKNGLSTKLAATALNSLILAIGASAGESGELLDDLNINLDQGLGPALVAVGKASDGALGKLRELIPNMEGLRAAASATADGGEGFTRQLRAMADGVSDFNRAYEIMSASYEQAVARNEAAHKRLETAVGATGLEGKAAALNGMADGADALAESVENNSAAWTLLTRTSGEAWGWLNRVNGEIEGHVAALGNAALAYSMFGTGGTAVAEALRDVQRAAAGATGALGGLPFDKPGAGAVGPFGDAESAAAAASASATAAAEAGLAAAAAVWGVTNTTPVFNAESGKWIDQEKTAQEIADDITAAYAEAAARLSADPPTIAKDWSPLVGSDGGEDDPLMLFEDIMRAEQERAEQLNGYYGDADGERLAHINGYMTPEEMAKVGAEADAHIARMVQMQDEQDVLASAVTGVAANFERLASNSLSAMLSGKNGAVQFGQVLRTVVLDALSAVIAKLLVIKALGFLLPGLGSGSGTGYTPMAAGGGIPRAAAGYTVPMGRAGLDSVPILAMPGEEVIDRSLSLGLRRFLAAQDAAAAAAPAGTGGRGNVSVVMQVARPIGYLDVLDLGNAAAAAALKVSEANL